MRKILIYVMGLVILSFFIPIFLTHLLKNNKQTVDVEVPLVNKIDNTVQSQTKDYIYENYGKVKVLYTKTNEIKEVDIDEYLYGVVCAEMPVDFEEEALKAQAIVARTYTVYKISQNAGKHGEADICDNSACCQAWISKSDRQQRWEGDREEKWNKIVSVVENTKGKIITYENQPINAFFHSNSGGKTEVPLNVWGGSGYPYLQTVETSGEEIYTQYSSEVSLSKKEFISKIKKSHTEFKIDFSNPDCIKILETTQGDRVKTIKIGNVNLSGVEVRKIFQLRSAKFTVQIKEENIIFNVIGYGHGVGMSQTGADSLAKQGYNYEEIIKHFYTGIEIIDL